MHPSALLISIHQNALKMKLYYLVKLIMCLKQREEERKKSTAAVLAIIDISHGTDSMIQAKINISLKASESWVHLQHL